MLVRGDIIDGIPKTTIKITHDIKTGTKGAIEWLKTVRMKIDSKSPLYYNEVIINNRISLWIPGKYDEKYSGDYLLTWDGKAPCHKDVCDAIISTFDEQTDMFEKNAWWVRLLEDVYYNGTQNINIIAQNEKERFIMTLIFWVTLQEDIHHYEKLGRLTPFCRYVEALSTRLPNAQHNYEELLLRLETNDPCILEKWELPIEPSFYKWSAF